MELNSKIYVAGHNGLVGSAIVRKLKELGYTNIITKTSKELDLRIQTSVYDWFYENKPEYVFLAAAKVGGIKSNSLYKGQFIFDNLMIQTNIISASNGVGVKKLLFLGSSCFTADTLITTNEGYKLIAEIKVGDKVIDHNGDEQLVSAINKSYIKEDIFNIKPMGLPTINVTREHPFYMSDGTFKNAEDISLDDKLVLPLIKYNSMDIINLITDKVELNKRKAFSFIKNGGEVKEASVLFGLEYNTISGYKYNKTPKSNNLNEKCYINDIAWLSGVFLAEGWLSGSITNKRGGRHNIAFSPGYNVEFKDKIVNSIIKIFNIVPKVSKERTSFKISLDNKYIYSFFEQFYTSGIHKSNTKKVPNFIINSNDLCVKNFIKGYFDGDGCRYIRKDRKNQYTCISSSTSYSLSFGVSQLLLRLGIFNSINYLKKNNKTIIENRIVNQQNQYSVRINGNYAIKFINEIYDECFTFNKTIDKGVTFSDNNVLIPVCKIQKSYYEGFVYNFTVENTNTYCANHVAVHNCIYPKMCPQPIKEEYLLSGYLEPSNDAYAIAKIAGIKMCQSYNLQYETNFISAMPTNMYGIGDNYDLDNSHVLPALIRKILTANKKNLPFVEVWGSGNPRREFLYSDDLADACVYLMNNYNESEIINIGTGEDITIKDLAYLICDIVGYKGEIIFNTNMPDGTMQKVLDVSKINNIGWKHKISLKDGIIKVINEVKYNNWE